jgi:formate hydrogenlyase subunit 4
MTSLLLTLFQTVVILLLAPFAFGLIRYLKAYLVGRRGMNPFMPYMNMLTLLKKENLISTSSSWVFRLAPYMTLAASIALAVTLPLLVVQGAFASFSHFLLFIGILSFATVFMMFGAIDAGSVFSSIGGSRQMLITAFTIPTFVLIFVSFAISSSSTTLDGMMSSGISVVSHPFLAISILSLVLISLAENDRYPVDNPETSLELTMIREAIAFNYSGPYLAMVEYASMIKLVVFELLIVNFLFPLPFLSLGEGIGDLILVLIATVAKVFFAGFMIALLETVVAKMKFYRLQEYLSTAFFLSLAGAVLVVMKSHL